MKRLIECIGDGLIISYGAFSLHLLSRIWIYGEVLAYEGNELILAIEIGLAALIVLFGIQRLIDDLMGRQ